MQEMSLCFVQVPGLAVEEPIVISVSRTIKLAVSRAYRGLPEETLVISGSSALNHLILERLRRASGSKCEQRQKTPIYIAFAGFNIHFEQASA